MNRRLTPARPARRRPDAAPGATRESMFPARERPRACVLLIDALDAAGAFPADAATRARVLELALGPVATHVLSGEAVGPAAVRRSVAAALAQVQPEVVVVASSAPGGGIAAQAIHGHAAAWWWPTGVGHHQRFWTPWNRRKLRGLAPIPGRDVDPAPSFRGATEMPPLGAEALDWAACDPAALGRPRLPLWDGRYLLAPVPLDNGAGSSLLEAFAALEARWDRVELVVLGSVQPECQRRARSMGIASRVHFAGPATAEAEFTWIASAAGVVLANRGPVAGSLLLRVLACGTPLVAFGDIGGPVHGWLADRGALPESWTSTALPGRTKLEHLLERDRAVELAVARGREIAAQHAADRIGERLRAALEGDSRRRAA